MNINIDCQSSLHSQIGFVEDSERRLWVIGGPKIYLGTSVPKPP